MSKHKTLNFRAARLSVRTCDEYAPPPLISMLICCIKSLLSCCIKSLVFRRSARVRPERLWTENWGMAFEMFYLQDNMCV